MCKHVKNISMFSISAIFSKQRSNRREGKGDKTEEQERSWLADENTRPRPELTRKAGVRGKAGWGGSQETLRKQDNKDTENIKTQQACDRTMTSLVSIDVTHFCY